MNKNPLHKYISSIKNISGGGFFVAAIFIANIANFIFNAFLGRSLSFEQFGLITLVATMWNLLMIPLGSLSATINHRVAYLNVHDSRQAAVSFSRRIEKQTTVLFLLLTLVWIVLTPFLANYFHVPQVVLFSMSPAFIAGALSFVIRGYFAGTMSFGLAGALIFFESLGKLAFGFSFVLLGLGDNAYLSIPLSALLTIILAKILLAIKTKKIQPDGKTYAFPRRFYAASVTSGFAVTMFLTIDVIMAKHYLTPEIAGQYAFLSLIGKMVFFFGSLINSFVITYVSRDEAEGKDTNRTFYRFLLAVTGLTLFAYLGVGVFGYITTPILFGAKALAIVPYLPKYALAIALYTVTGYIVLFHLARKHYLFSIIAILIAAIGGLVISFYHDSIATITNVIFTMSVINFFLTSLFHFLHRDGEFILRNLVDLSEAFFPLKEKPHKEGTKRILIYNWRDTKHMFAGGAEVYIQELAKRWVKQGHSVTIFCGNDSKSERDDVIDGVRIIRRGGFYFVYVWAFLYYLTQFRGRFDHIVDCQNGIPFFTPLYAKEPITGVVHHIHQEIFRTHLSPPMAFVARILENRFMPVIYKKVRFITVSESTKKEMESLEMVGSGIKIVHNGIDLSVFKPAQKDASPLVVYVGRLKYYKSLNIFIKTAVAIHNTIPSAKFVIAGEGEERKGLTKLIDALHASSFITLKGYVTEEEKVALYQRAWVFMNPSLMEGWGITTIEANACGTVVVASDVSGLRDSVQHGVTGMLVPHGDIQTFTDLITMLINDTAKRQKMEKQALLWAKRYMWDESAKQFLEYMESTIDIRESHDKSKIFPFATF